MKTRDAAQVLMAFQVVMLHVFCAARLVSPSRLLSYFKATPGEALMSSVTSDLALIEMSSSGFFWLGLHAALRYSNDCQVLPTPTLPHRCVSS